MLVRGLATWMKDETRETSTRILQVTTVKMQIRDEVTKTVKSCAKLSGRPDPNEASGAEIITWKTCLPCTPCIEELVAQWGNAEGARS